MWVSGKQFIHKHKRMECNSRETWICQYHSLGNRIDICLDFILPSYQLHVNAELCDLLRVKNGLAFMTF